MTTTAPTAEPSFVAGPPKRLLIGGEWVEASSGETYDTVNPATGKALTAIARAGAEDVDRAVRAARRAVEGPWSRLGPVQRQRILLDLADLAEEHADELALLDSLDMGAPLSRVRPRGAAIVSYLRWYAAQARSIRGETIENSAPHDFFTYTLKEPVGVVGAITPWNGPLMSAVWKLGPVLATGCTVVHKPAEESPLTALRFAELCLEAGVPEGVVNVVPGGRDAGAALVEHAGVDMVSFTGSVETGRKIIRASAGNVKRLMLELGGKSPGIVLADCDLEQTVAGTGLAVFANTGQMCIAGSRLFVERPIYDEFVERVAQFGESLVVGDPLDPATDLGPLASASHLERVSTYVRSGWDEGGCVVTGGERLRDEQRRAGYFFPPTVFTDVRDDMQIVRDEIFGPVVAVLPFEELEEAARDANATEYGLGAYVWTNDVRKAHRLGARLRAGSVWVNTPPVTDPAVPFGGYKHSGYGREGGVEQIDEHLHVKSVWIKTS
jgi:aldehyde dehydrogenase (NAD+)